MGVRGSGRPAAIPWPRTPNGRPSGPETGARRRPLRSSAPALWSRCGPGPRNKQSAHLDRTCSTSERHDHKQLAALRVPCAAPHRCPAAADGDLAPVVPRCARFDAQPLVPSTGSPADSKALFHDGSPALRSAGANGLRDLRWFQLTHACAWGRRADPTTRIRGHPERGLARLHGGQIQGRAGGGTGAGRPQAPPARRYPPQATQRHNRIRVHCAPRVRRGLRRSQRAARTAQAPLAIPSGRVPGGCGENGSGENGCAGRAGPAHGGARGPAPVELAPSSR